MPLTQLMLIVAFALFPQQPPAAPAVAPSGSAEVAAFVEALNTCTAAKAATPHPLMKSFTVEHTIAGARESGCDYRQTMPGKMAMACMLSVEGRKAIATELSVYVKDGTMSGSTSSAPPVWMNECELEMPDGKRQPMVQPRRN